MIREGLNLDFMKNSVTGILNKQWSNMYNHLNHITNYSVYTQNNISDHHIRVNFENYIIACGHYLILSKNEMCLRKIQNV